MEYANRCGGQRIPTTCNRVELSELFGVSSRTIELIPTGVVGQQFYASKLSFAEAKTSTQFSISHEAR